MIPHVKGGYTLKGCQMQRVDGNYLYTVGGQLHPLADLKSWEVPGGVPATTYASAMAPLYIAEGALEPLLTRSIFRLRTSVHAGNALLIAIRTLRAKIDAMNEAERGFNINFHDLYSVQQPLGSFEAVLAAEFALLPLYVVTQTAGFDTSILIEHGSQCFPAELAIKAPEAIPDLLQGTRCIAFELPTAAGFHLHRANEAILRRYWDAVTQGSARPKSRNMGDYLKELDAKKAGDEKVRAALRHLKDFHRNPLVHPEDSLENTDEAVALMNSIHTVIVNMLKEMPAIAAPDVAPIGSLTTAS